jgi:hypothetical protein
MGPRRTNIFSRLENLITNVIEWNAKQTNKQTQLDLMKSRQSFEANDPFVYDEEAFAHNEAKEKKEKLAHKCFSIHE